MAQAFAECGRIAEPEHLLHAVDPVDDTYRRQMDRRLTGQETRHELAQNVHHGKGGNRELPRGLSFMPARLPTHPVQEPVRSRTTA